MFMYCCASDARPVALSVDAPGTLDNISEILRQATVMQTPLGRLGTPKEMAALALFLATDDAAFFVGATLSPNGGYVTV